MNNEPISTLTKKSGSAANFPSSQSLIRNFSQRFHPSALILNLSHFLVGASVMIAALLSGADLDWIQLLEHQTQSIFFQIRGSIVPPSNIIILAIDDQSISIPKQYYKANPGQYAYLESLKSFPFKRSAYSQIISKLVKAGAKSVALDIVFDTSSTYGDEDDRQLQETLQKYGNKVVLAALYENSEMPQGKLLQLVEPQQIFHTASVSIGSASFPLAVDGKIHSLAGDQDQNSANLMPSFAESVLRAAQIKYPQHSKGSLINFWGPEGTFETIPLWYVLEPTNWNNYLQQGKFFQNKIVLIGATTNLSHDHFPVAISPNWLYPEPMSGVEIHANAIASLLENQTIAPAIPHPIGRGLFVLLIAGSTVCLLTLNPQGMKRLFLSMAGAGIWLGISYGSFFYLHLAFPTTLPIIAIIASGLFYLITEVGKEKWQGQQVISEITSPQDRLRDSGQSKELGVIGKILGGRYKVIQVLGAGGFSETYIAEDLQLPDQPECVVKHLKPADTKADGLELIRRLFNSEAQSLRKLGKHPEIPELLAYFEEDEQFYLVQEYIVGHPLSKEIPLGKTSPESMVMNILKELLQILVFVHDNNVIHRDIKPSNIIRRESDQKLVLIDFGAVKEVSTQQLNHLEQSAFTIGIGTKGYAPSEQCFGRPQYNSDIYAVGMIGIKALSGRAPHELEKDLTGEVKWEHLTIASQPLIKIINKMVMNDCRDRYQSASEVLAALANLQLQGNRPVVLGEYLEDTVQNPC